ncbi:MAG: hypothetical protein M1814_003785 [Vezdaea aestivalis]|nr:MAG: hypothetical protein M1814_003785 [Vezdaea aestivalis]
MEEGLVNEETLGINIVKEGKTPVVVDIVFVHGLNGDPFQTWTKDEVMWPRDLLPEAIPGARIMTYGYDANPIKFFDNTSQNHILEHALNLLNGLINERDTADERHRRIIFVGHSLGGLVVKNALCEAHDAQSGGNKPDVADIMANTFGVVFMGTPHQGSSHASFQTLMANFAKAVLRDDDDRLIKALQMGSETTASLANRFTNFASSLQIRTCTEELGFGKVGKIVDDFSAILHLPNEVVCSIHANHREMVRFSNAKEHSYKQAMGAIRQIKNRIPATGPINAADQINSTMLATNQRSLQMEGAVAWAITKTEYQLGPRGHLSFTEGEMITNIITLPGPFWQGQIDDRVGMFPYTYVTLPKGKGGPEAQNDPTQVSETNAASPSRTPTESQSSKLLGDLPSPEPEQPLPNFYAKTSELEQVQDAINCEEPNRLRRMLGLGFDVAWTGEARHELLVLAVDTKNPEIVTILLERGAFAKKKEWDRVLLEHAILSQKPETVKLIIERIDIEIVNENFPSAVSNGRLNIVEAFVDHGADLNVHDSRQGWTPMHHAAAQVTTQLSQYLLSKGAEINSVDKRSRTPLHIAVLDLRYLDVIKELVQAGADLGAKDYRGHTPLHLAVRYWNHKRAAPAFGQLMTSDVDALVAGMSYLIDSGCTLGTVNYKANTPLHDAVRFKSLALVELLVQRGAPLSQPGYEQATPMDRAAESGKLRSVNTLLQAGAKPDIQDSEGWNCLHWATLEDELEISARLLSQGAPVNPKIILTPFAPGSQATETGDAPTNEGEPLPVVQQLHPDWGIAPLHFAAGHANLALIKLLLEHGADINQQAIDTRVMQEPKPPIRNGSTAFTLAASASNGEYLDVLKLLLESGADMTMQDELDSSLHHAARSAPDAVVQWLLGNGFPVDVVNAAGLTPLQTVVLQDGSPSDSADAYMSTIGILLDAGADIEAQTSAEEMSLTCLHLAVSLGWELKVKQLLERGASIKTLDSSGRTPLQSAASGGRTEILRLLLSAGAGTTEYENDRAAALYLATKEGKAEAVALLEQFQAGTFEPVALNIVAATANGTVRPSERPADNVPVSVQSGDSLTTQVDEVVEKSKQLASRFKKGWKAFLE